jgi:1-acyl-sn-glycerol-3-phosphate acyltransferase
MRYNHYGLPRIFQGLAWLPGRLLLQHYFHLKVLGEENIREAAKISKRQGVGIIFAANHTNSFDPIIILAGIHPLSPVFPVYFVGQKGNAYRSVIQKRWFSIICGGVFFYLWGNVPTKSGKKDYSIALENHKKILINRGALCIFPEGGGYSKRESQRGKAHGGAGYLVKETNALIIPVYIDGLWQLTEKDFWNRKRYATIRYGKPFFLETQEMGDTDNNNNFQEMSERILDHIYESQ